MTSLDITPTPRARRPRPKVVTLSDAAANRVREIMDRAVKPYAGLRVGVKNGGCAGQEYVLEYAEAANALDEVVEDKGVTILVEPKADLMQKLGKKQLVLQLHQRLAALPAGLAAHRLELAADGAELTFTYDVQADRTGITALLDDLARAGIAFKDLRTTQSSLEDIFVSLVRKP